MNQKFENLLTQFETERLELKSKRKILFPFLLAIPLVITGIVYFYFLQTFGVLMTTLFSAYVFSSIIYGFTLGRQFETLLDKVKTAFVEKFMEEFHPKIEFSYTPNAGSGSMIVGQSGLISFDKIYEEDVVKGQLKNGTFYFSEVKLVTTDSEGDESTKFKGILFKIKIPGKNFPESTLQGSPGLLNRIFGTYQKNEKFDFWYQTSNEYAFNNEMASLFPFIKYLQKNQGELRIKAIRNEITILMKSDMLLFDEPPQQITRSFLEKVYRHNIGKQLNTLLYLAESFITDSQGAEIERNLELKMLEKLNREGT